MVGLEVMGGKQRRDLILLLALALIVRLATAALLTRPGYMDVAYYAAGAVRLAQGGGLVEPFLWNYLDDPAGLPHPGFLYWMPLPALLAAPFAASWPASFFALQLPFAFLSAVLPLVAYGLAWEVAGRHRPAWLAGLLTLFSGFFFPYWTLPETFAPFALLGSTALWLAVRKSKTVGGQRGTETRPAGWSLPLACGGLVGLAHLTRADGILLLPVVALAPLVSCPSRSTHHAPRITRRVLRSVIRRSSLVVLGYLLIMAPWFLRNLATIGVPLSPAGARTLWLRTYDDFFCFECDLSLRSYLAWGWRGILRSKLWAAGVNVERFLAENCLVFLSPFALAGFHRLRRHPPFILSLVYLILVYFVHSLAFTFPGPRGGFFHASAPVLPFLFAAGVEGLEAAVAWAAHRRRWELRQAQAFFGAGAVALAMLVGLYAAAQKLPAWRRADGVYEDVGQWLAGAGVEGETVMVANPPAFWYHTGYPAVVVPNGDVEVLLSAVDRYAVRYVLLDRNHPLPLAGLFGGAAAHPRLRPVAMWAEGEERAILYAVEPRSSCTPCPSCGILRVCSHAGSVWGARYGRRHQRDDCR